MGPVMAKVGTPAALACLPALSQTSDVDAYQAAARALAGLCSAHLAFPAHQALLGNLLTQPRAVTVRVLARTQDAGGLLRAGGEGALGMLVVLGGRDRMIVGGEAVRAVEGWRELRVVEIEEADHMPWVGQAQAAIFREKVLGWVREVVERG